MEGSMVINIEILRHLSIRSDTAINIIEANIEKTDDDLLLYAGIDYLSGRRDATNYHTASLLYKLYTL